VIEAGILTSEHVVRGANEVQVVGNDGTQVVATVSQTDADRDLALLSASVGWPYVAMEPAQLQRQGETILVFGYPRPEVLVSGLTLTRGLVSAIRRDEIGVVYIQTDAAVNAGGSGGPMVNMRAKVVGIASFAL
jgi:S1-C subfamily serine protease